MRFNNNIKNLIGGVSTQPQQLRHESQVDEMINFVPNETGTVSVRNVFNKFPVKDTDGVEINLPYKTNSAVHSYDRGDGDEKYAMLLNSQGLSIFNRLGNEMKLKDTSGNTINDRCLSLDEMSSFFSSYEIDSNLEDVMQLGTTDRVRLTAFSTTIYLGRDMINVIHNYLNMPHYSIAVKENNGEGYIYVNPQDKMESDGTVTLKVGIYRPNTSGGYYFHRYEDVKFSTSFSYSRDIKFLTIGDTTWLLNKKQVVGYSTTDQDAGTSGSKLIKKNRAFYWANKSFDNGQGSGYTYSITIDGATYSTNKTSTISAISDLKSKLSTIAETEDITSNLVFMREETNEINEHFYFYDTGTTEPKSISFSCYAGEYEWNNVEVAGSDTNGTYSWNRIYVKSTNQNEFVNVNLTNISYRYIVIECGDAAPVFNYIAIQSSTGSRFNLKQVDSVLMIEDKDNIAFSFESGDSYGNQASSGWTDSVSKLSDLPSSMDGFTEEEIGIISITGTDKDSFTSYYIKWNSEGWKETCSYDSYTSLDEKTMPIKIVRTDIDTFTIGYNIDYGIPGFINNWEKREVGDEDSNPLPSFTDNNISNMFFFRNRLCFASEENVIMSETGSYYNFFSTTAMEILDNDVIDAAIDSDSVSIIRNITVGSGSVVLWCDNGQFLIGGGDILSPATTRISKTSGYISSTSLEPVSIDNEVTFFRKNNDGLKVFAYSPAILDADKTTAMQVNAHCFGYVPETIKKVALSLEHNLLFMIDSESGDIYAYKYFLSGTERLLNSWFKITIDEVYVDNIMCFDEHLFIIYTSDKGGTYQVGILDISRREDDDESSNDLDTIPLTGHISVTGLDAHAEENLRNFKESFNLINAVIASKGDYDIKFNNNTNSISNQSFKKNSIMLNGNSSDTTLTIQYPNSNGGSKTPLVSSINIEGKINIKSNKL